ncbi:MAG: hypothetical protein EWV81_20950 [Microcystis aeruginosa Ma_SC_T_19800800_S464]|uniref:Uncharacterized protein n=1 Tax=Microcystis aeruginosa Ma_SC_T_19800800_S464 TaxID=2486257 RepID=A0A552DFU4_MICAE|nr:MAG: hypothetical protein EWV81_20950 [Microcystis aeruginosa Ma_SC_T_19800800_S464]
METSLLDTISTLSPKLTAIETKGNPLPKVVSCSSTCATFNLSKAEYRYPNLEKVRHHPER